MIFIIPALTAFGISLLVTPVVRELAIHFGLVDDPHKRHHPAHTHAGIIPRAGGLALFLGILLPIVLFLPLNKALIGIILAMSLTTLVGLLDDWQDISPYLRFLTNITTALFVVGAGIGIPFITNPFGGILHLDSWRIAFQFFGLHTIWVWADLFAIIWIVWTMNIVGWSSGVDGQMPGFVVVTAIILGVMSLKFSAHDISQTTIATLAFITAGAYLGFLPWNFYPQKIMPGYGGKTLAGLLLATLAILSGAKVGSALLILLIPMIDALYALTRRLLTKKSPFRPDKAHLHHRLLKLGWGKRRIALFYWSASAILGLLTLFLSSKQKVYILLAVSVMIVGSLVWIALLTEDSSYQSHAD